MPELMRALSVCGFPEEMRKTTVDHEAIFEAWGALPAIEAFTERDILITFDPLRDQPSPWAVGGLPPLGLNLSGASGGPALMYGIHRGLLRWFPVGLVIGGPKGRGEGALSEFDIISIRRIHVVENDGKIRKDNDGWLP